MKVTEIVDRKALSCTQVLILVEDFPLISKYVTDLEKILLLFISSRHVYFGLCVLPYYKLKVISEELG